MTAPYVTTETTPMAFTPHAVHENATPDPNEVLVSGVDDRGIPQNVLLRNAPELRARLAAVPAAVPNPDHIAISAELEAARTSAEALATQLADTPPEVNGAPNPDHATLSEQMTAAATTVASLAEQVATTPPVLPNPDRAPIIDEVFAVAVKQAEDAAKVATDVPVAAAVDGEQPADPSSASP